MKSVKMNTRGNVPSKMAICDVLPRVKAGICISEEAV
jgi:hypothetical protein